MRNAQAQKRGQAFKISAAAVPAGWTEVPTMTWGELQEECGLVFNVLVADCEGALCGMLADEPDMLCGFGKLVIKQDGPAASRQCLRELLASQGFVRTYSMPLDDGHGDTVEDSLELWTRPGCEMTAVFFSSADAPRV